LLHTAQPHNLENKFVREGCTFDLIGHLFKKKYTKKNDIHEMARSQAQVLSNLSLTTSLIKKKKFHSFSRSMHSTPTHQTIQEEKKRKGVFPF